MYLFINLLHILIFIKLELQRVSQIVLKLKTAKVDFRLKQISAVTGLAL